MSTVNHSCPSCGSTHVARSHRRGIQEAVVLKSEGLSPYRCRDCDTRFMQPSLHAGRHRRGTQSLVRSLGIRDARQRRRIARLALTAVLTVLALVIAFLLFGYFTHPAPPVDAALGGIFAGGAWPELDEELSTGLTPPRPRAPGASC